MRIRSAVAAGLVLAVACAEGPEREDEDDAEEVAEHAAVRDSVLARMRAYQATARSTDMAQGAAFFGPGGTLFEPGIPPIVGPDSIRAFIKSFPGVIVDSASLWADTVEVDDGTAYVWGHYFEALRFPGQPKSEQDGRFVMQWTRSGDGNWYIHRYYRIPLPARPPANTPR